MTTKNLPNKEVAKWLKEVMEENKIDLQFEISLCFSDIPKTHMNKAKNGKIYGEIIVGIRKEPDQWGRDLKVYMKPSKQDREQKAPKNYVGGGRMITFVQSQGENPTDNEIDNLFEPTKNSEENNCPY